MVQVQLQIVYDPATGELELRLQALKAKNANKHEAKLARHLEKVIDDVISASVKAAGLIEDKEANHD